MADKNLRGATTAALHTTIAAQLLPAWSDSSNQLAMDPFWATVFGAGPGPREDLILTTYSPLLYVERSVDLQRATFRTPREEAKRNGQLFAQRAQASLSAPPTQSLFRQATNALPQPTFGGSEEK